VLWLADGFQRCAAAADLRVEGIEPPADILEGSRKDALVFAAGADAGHGLRRTQADRRRAIAMLLEASPCGVTGRSRRPWAFTSQRDGGYRPPARRGGTRRSRTGKRCESREACKALQRILREWPRSGA
jgi:hypothetical protein